MAITLEQANIYINSYCVDIEEWEIIEDSKRQRFLNVSERTLNDAYKNLIIPDEAVYEFANLISIMFSDVNRLALQGIDNFTLVGMGTFEFGNNTITHASKVDLKNYIPQIVTDMINKANDIKSSNRKIKWTGV